MNAQIESYMMVGFHTLVTMERVVSGYRIVTYGVTPQCNGLDVAKLVTSSWTDFKRSQYANTEMDAVQAFAGVVARELRDEREALESMRTTQHITTMVA